MRFSAISVSLASALAVNGAAVPVVAQGNISAREANPVNVETVTFAGAKVDNVVVARSDEAAPLAERQAGVTAVVSGLGAGAMSVATEVAVNLITDTLRAVVDWTAAREAFTQKTATQMYKTNPDPKKFPAAICYNQGYRVKDPKGIDGKASVTLRSNVLHVSYDCMYMTAANAFYTDGDGGAINLYYAYDGKRCSFDKATGDLTCK
ncbi:uncharacterized protein ColSpa_03634 [Colletotrichum spaethianum]|uniref:DUF7888 domain-containing protein n=1 Tax=Colletotrichum spaethianum TaxID=700344 RepID=A0AA37L7W1_9PEZI|nr:uncharacterized protein ColSpa_03634 [Colletotrichum spaethianum]GKT43453.1 hypothetical protein ColSpa_03634 [Colletotrichum spaethianum]